MTIIRHYITISQCLAKQLQLNGTALPSLALENLQELEDLSLSGPDRDEAERTVAGALASIYGG